ncbi:MAG: cytochrome c maturation protein CcmE [Candidatus Acidiferrales bacterium]
MSTRGKFAVGSGIIIVTLLSLAYAGFTQSKTYYHTLSELPTLQGMALHQRMRIGGNVRAGSIQHLAGRVDFVLEEQGKTLPVSYAGRDPLPDTFKDGAQALVEGNLMPDGRFVAEQIQAKCASKYEASPTQPATSGASTGSGTAKTAGPGQPAGNQGDSTYPSKI